MKVVVGAGHWIRFGSCRLSRTDPGRDAEGFLRTRGGYFSKVSGWCAPDLVIHQRPPPSSHSYLAGNPSAPVPVSFLTDHLRVYFAILSVI